MVVAHAPRWAISQRNRSAIFHCLCIIDIETFRLNDNDDDNVDIKDVIQDVTT
jgi:hypothetical protein